MNVSLARELSVYALALGVEVPPQPLRLSPATVLSQVRAQIDLLIEQQIPASLWVKLPPGEIWLTEIQRYHQQVNVLGDTYTCYFEEQGKEEDREVGEVGGVGGVNSSPAEIFRVQFPSNSPIRREYFLMVLSPQFCSLIVANKPLKKKIKKQRSASSSVSGNKKLSLQVITSSEGRLIERILEGLKQSIPELFPLVKEDFVCPPAPESKMLSYLLVKQLQRQNEINRHLTSESYAKAQQQNKKLQNTIQLKDEYLNSVCQELRTPLTHMKTALSLLNSPNMKAPQRQRYLQMLKRECDRQNSLINAVLELVNLESNLEKMALESVRLSDVVPGIISTYQPLALEKGIMLAYTVPTDLPAVWCVSGGIKQIVINLLSNSINFTENGGQVWVRGRVQGDCVQLEFRDTGVGIAESEMPKIFDRFYSMRPVASEDSAGAGLGLTIVEQLLRRSGGSISFKSKQLEGSTFTVQLAQAREN